MCVSQHMYYRTRLLLLPPPNKVQGPLLQKWRLFWASTTTACPYCSSCISCSSGLFLHLLCCSLPMVRLSCSLSLCFSWRKRRNGKRTWAFWLKMRTCWGKERRQQPQRHNLGLRWVIKKCHAFPPPWPPLHKITLLSATQTRAKSQALFIT